MKLKNHSPLFYLFGRTRVAEGKALKAARVPDERVRYFVWENGVLGAAASCAFDVHARYSKCLIYTHKTVKCYLNKGQMQSADKGLCVERELKEGAALFSLSLFRQSVCSATSSLSPVRIWIFNQSATLERL